MTVRTIVHTSEYHDSVSLMLVARELVKLPGVEDAAVVMATEANKGLLKTSGLLSPEVEAATPNDLVIAIKGDGQLEEAMAEAEQLLAKKASSEETSDYRPKTLRGAVQSRPEANVCVISVAGRYAADEAWDALRSGLHVLLFSDNVSLEDEIALKQYARANGLLLMGPGAGTTIINGVALGFANVVPDGPVGIVSAAGTGLQEVSTLLAKRGIGLTQGLGVGGRDLKEDVGGLMMLSALEALQADPATEVIVLISKPPSEAVSQKVFAQVGQSPKPTVVCFMGSLPDLTGLKNAVAAATLHEAAHLAAVAGGAKLPKLEQALKDEQAELRLVAGELRQGLATEQRYLRGLYSGGTLCYETQVILRQRAEVQVFSNAPLDTDNQLPDSNHSQGHAMIDLGEEEFTVGRPHPMIDNDLRIRRLLQEAADPEVAAILLDVVIGYGAHDDPSSELGPAVANAKKIATEAGRQLPVLASVTGTEQDPQGLSRTRHALEAAGVVVLDSNAAVARLAALLVSV